MPSSHKIANIESSTPWRDEQLLVVAPQHHDLPPICVATGAVRDASPKWILLRRPLGNIWRTIMPALGFIAAAVSIPFWLPMIWSAPLTITFLLAAGYCVSWANRAELRTMLGYVSNEVQPVSFRARVVAVVFGPLLLAVSLIALFSIQWYLGAALDRSLLVGLTCVSLLGVVGGLIGFFVGAACRPGPVTPRLIIKAQMGPYLWVQGVHPDLLNKLPACPPLDDLESTLEPTLESTGGSLDSKSILDATVS